MSTTTTDTTDPWPNLLDRLTASSYCHVDMVTDLEVRGAAQQYIAALRACVAVGSLTLEQAVEECEDQIAKGHTDA